MARRCRIIKDDGVPGGQFVVPECWPGALARDDEEAMDVCICNERAAHDYDSQRIDALEKEVARLKKLLKREKPAPG
jgi:hypothetical protein